jgi:hypothetical protein
MLAVSTADHFMALAPTADFIATKKVQLHQRWLSDQMIALLAGLKGNDIF